MRRSRSGLAVKPAQVAGLTLYAGQSLWDDWVQLVYLEKAVDAAALVAVTPGKPNEDLLVLNPEGRLPALVDRELMLNGEQVIAEYLEERYPHPRLMPTDPAGRARVRMVLERFKAEVFPVVVAARAPKAPLKDREALYTAISNSGHWFPNRGYFIGTEFSLVDCAWAVWFHAVLMLPNAPRLPEASRSYFERLVKRKSVATLRNSAPRPVVAARPAAPRK